MGVSDSLLDRGYEEYKEEGEEEYEEVYVCDCNEELDLVLKFGIHKVTDQYHISINGENIDILSAISIIINAMSESSSITHKSAIDYIKNDLKEIRKRKNEAKKEEEEAEKNTK